MEQDEQKPPVLDETPLPATERPTAPAAEQQERVPRTRGARAGAIASRVAVPLALLAVILGFGIARPSTFLTIDNFKFILIDSSAAAVLGMGLTVVLVMGEFDLSIGSMLGLGGASAVAMMSLHGASWSVSILVAVGLALVVGVVNALLIAYAGMSSFIATLAMGTMLVGTEFLFTGDTTVYSGVAPQYLKIGQAVAGGINVQVWIALGVAVILWVLLERSESGRYMYAIGGNREASRLTGLPVKRYLTYGFVIVAVAATLAGIMITAQNGASSPQAGIPYLLPAYAAAFLGSTTFRPGQFNIPGTLVSVFFLGVVGAGLTMLSLSTAAIDLVQGGILVFAMLLSRLGRVNA